MHAMLVLHRTIAPSHSPFSDGFSQAEAGAHTDADQGAAADAAGDHAKAASLYLSCGQRYQAVPDADPQLPHALKNAEICFQNAAWAYADAGQFDAVGRAKLEEVPRDPIRERDR